MDKEIVDKIVIDYLQTIYGFALSKTNTIAKAEELASQIVLDVYTSLLRYNNIENINGYIYRVSANVYAKFTDKNKRGIHLSLDEVIDYNPYDYYDFVDEIIQGESYQLMKREIQYLSKLQRQIIVKHYFESKKIKDIARELNLPEGTVKWHLHDAKNTMKEGMNKMREKGTLAINPIKFGSMGHSGTPGQLGDTSYFLRSILNQNIAYAAYHNAKTINEIADELNVSPVFIQDEIDYLVEYGFIDKVENDKYLTNIVISEGTKELDIKLYELRLKYAKIVKEKYVPLLIPVINDLINDEKVYVPDNDLNYLTWSVIAYALSNKLYGKTESIDTSRYNVKRPDGGEYVAMASVISDYRTDLNYDKYNVCGSMTRTSEKYPIYSWQINTYYDDREGYWANNLSEDYEYVYEIYNNLIKKDEMNADKFKRLYDKGYFINDKINIVMFKDTMGKLSSILPDMTNELLEISKQYSKEIYEIEKVSYPKHMHDWIKASRLNPLGGTCMYVVEMLVDDGTLKPLTDEQKHGVNTIMCINL